MVKHTKNEALFKRKVSDKDENCIVSTSTRKELPFDDQMVKLEEQPCKIQKVTLEEFESLTKLYDL